MAVPQGLACPTCQRQLAWTPEFPFRPFCSERCKMVDLGAWFAEERSVPGDEVDPTAHEQPD